MITHDLFEATPQQLRRAEQALVDARNRRARQKNPIAARRTDPETSQEAAQRAAQSAPNGRMLALSALAELAMTDFELAAKTGWQATSIGKRRGELMAAGFVRPLRCGGIKRITRPAPSGSPAQVWEVTPEGLAHLAYLRNVEEE